jgi:hypothetical protein
MSSSGKIIKGLDQFLDQMKTLHSDDIYKVLRKAEVSALTKPRDKLASMYGTFKGKNDENQTDAQKAWRWRAKKHQPMHPIKESRLRIAHNIYSHKIIPKEIGKNKATVWARIWGRTQNSWLIEHGRYVNPSRAYQGWQIFRKFFQMYGATINAKFTEDVGYGLEKVFARIAKEMNKAAR